jgi:enoyl-CoA hydratase/carnithine racemase
MSGELLEERNGRVLNLTINRPEKRNSLSPEIMLQLGDTLNDLASTDEVRCVVIRGTGDRAFSSGYDIGRIAEGARAAQAEGARRNPLAYGIDSVVSFPYPVIAAARGYALGAGLHLAIASDLRIAAPGANFGMPPAKLGLVYPVEGYELFVRFVGFTTAKALFLTGRRFSAAEALEMGIVNHIEPDESFDSYVDGLAREIADENAPLAVKGAKYLLNRLADGPLSAEDQVEGARLMAQAFQSEDAREARAAFAEKRKPQFNGR